MKKILFFAVSAIMAVTGFCISVGEKIVSSITNGDEKIEQRQNQQLILEKYVDDTNLLAWRGSHWSHSSHSSHMSHISHESHISHISHISHTSHYSSSF